MLSIEYLMSYFLSIDAFLIRIISNDFSTEAANCSDNLIDFLNI